MPDRNRPVGTDEVGKEVELPPALNMSLGSLFASAGKNAVPASQPGSWGRLCKLHTGVC